MEFEWPPDIVIVRNRNRCKPLKKRLMERVVVSGAGCWEFWGPGKNYYGQIEFHGYRYPAHRVSYVLHKGPIPEGLFICHTCDNRRCINPDHLFLGTCKDNSEDMMRKGRGKNPTAETRKRWTHCMHGHEFTPENTHIKTNGRRGCRACDRLRARKKKKQTGLYKPLPSGSGQGGTA